MCFKIVYYAEACNYPFLSFSLSLSCKSSSHLVVVVVVLFKLLFQKLVRCFCVAVDDGVNMREFLVWGECKKKCYEIFFCDDAQKFNNEKIY